MIDTANKFPPGGLIPVPALPDRTAPAGGPAAVPGGLPRASKGAASGRRWLPDVLSARWWTLTFARPNATARAQSQSQSRSAGQAGHVDAAFASATGTAASSATASADGRGSQETRTAIFRSWSDEGPRNFDALYGSNGSLRRDVVTALWQRIEQLLPAAVGMPDGAANAAAPSDTGAVNAASASAAADPASVDHGDRPADGTMTDLELHSLTEKLKRAERMLGKRDSLELRAVKALTQQVLGARGSLGRPLLVARGDKQSDRYKNAGTASTFVLKTDRGIPKLPLSAAITPKIGATYSSGLEVSDDSWVRESRGVEGRLGVVGHIKAFFLKLDLGLTGRLNRTTGRSYTDQAHLLQAPGSSVYKAERDVEALRDLQRAASGSRWGGSKAFSLHTLDELRHKAHANYDEFAKTAALLGIVLQQPQAEVAPHPLVQSQRTMAASGTPFKTLTAGVKLQGDATLSATGETGVLGVLGVHGTAAVDGAKASTGVRTYVPVWKALDAGEAGRAGEEVTQKRLDDLRAAFVPMLRALQSYHAPSRAEFPRVLQAIASWQPGQPPVAAADLTGTLQALTSELDLYCHAARVAGDDPRARELARSVERAWGVQPKEGAYGYLRALAVTAALIDKHARDTQMQAQPQPQPQTQPQTAPQLQTAPHLQAQPQPQPHALAGFQALTERLFAPAMRHDDVLLRQATGFKDTLRINTWSMEIDLGADVGLKLPSFGVGADVSAKVKGTRVDHFIALKGGDFIDVDVSVGLGGSVGIGKLIEPLTQWAGGHLSGAIGSLSQAGLPADFASTLGALAGDAVTAISPAFGVHGRLIVNLNFSKPLAAPVAPATSATSANSANSATLATSATAATATAATTTAAAAQQDSASAAPEFILEHVRVLVRLDAAMSAEVRPLGMVTGRNASRSVLMTLDNCYGKSASREQGDRAARAFLESLPTKRDLPAIFANLGRDDSAATRQVRAFVLDALAHADAGTAQALRDSEANFFEAMRAYAVVAADRAQAPAAPGAGSAMPSNADEPNARLRAKPEYVAAEQALLALTLALRAPAGVRQGMHTEYATTLGKLRTKA